MSLLNAWISPAEAIVAVDTDGVMADGSRLVTSKLLTIPHLNSVMTSRGSGAYLQLLFLHCITENFESFDAMVNAMPALLKRVDADAPAHTNEGLVVGWSDHRRRMSGRAFARRDRAGETKLESEEADFIVSPWDASLSGISTKVAAVEKLASAQVRFMRRNFPNATCGGKLIVCRATKTSITTTHRMQFQAEEMAA
jgi:hypothetical protein